MISTRTISGSLLVLCSLTACGGGESPPPGKASVFKSMASVQCGAGLSLATLQGQLSAANVPVSAATCGAAAGLAQPAVCGAADGKIGIFEIPSDKVSAAAAAGFPLLSTMPGAITIACPPATQ